VRCTVSSWHHDAIAEHAVRGPPVWRNNHPIPCREAPKAGREAGSQPPPQDPSFLPKGQLPDNGNKHLPSD